MGATALITGGGGAIGAAAGRRLAGEGWTVALCDLREEAARAVAGEIPGAFALRADVSRPEEVEPLLRATLERTGGLDLLVNNAGVELRTPLGEHTVEDWERVIAVNASGPLRLAEACSDALASRGGAIVNVASIAVQGSGGQAAYDTSKGALLGITRALAGELAAFGVRVNAVCPGFIDTPMLRESDLFGIAQKVARHLPLGRIGTAQEVAAAVAFLGSADAAQLSGEALFVDGGMVRAPL